jgi:hypothetical protein
MLEYSLEYLKIIVIHPFIVIQQESTPKDAEFGPEL